LKKNKLIIGMILASFVGLMGINASTGSAEEMKDVPLRQMVESMKGTIKWNADKQEINLSLADYNAVLKIDSLDATVNGDAVKLDKKPYKLNGVTLVSSNTMKTLHDASDKVLITYSTVGDSRVDETVKDLPAQDYKWTVNTKVMSRMMKEIEAQHSKMFFFNGDMIMGYTANSDVNVLNRQYAYWRGLVANMYENGTYVFPVPGNHEVQDKYKDAAGKTIKIATKANENTWKDNMGDVILDEKRFAAIEGEPVTGWDANNYPQIGMDNISTDQSKLSYSYDYRGSHFVVINTDPVGNDGHPPTNWLSDDIAKAKKRGVSHIFVFGHKPAYTYYYDKTIAPAGLDSDMAATDAFWKVIEDNKATYFAGHEHIFNVMQPKGGKAYQVLVGSGGSPFEAQKPTDEATDTMYAWVTVKVFASGKVHMDAYGFDL
jgi:hypothetical protein